MQRFVGSQTSCGSAERPATAWQLKDVQRWLKQQHLQCSSHDMCNDMCTAGVIEQAFLSERHPVLGH